MFYAKSLRAIGQSLEILRVESFELEKKGDQYVVRSASILPTSQWIVRNNIAGKFLEPPSGDPIMTHPTGGDGWLCYDPFDIRRLDARGRRKRRRRAFGQMRGAKRLSQLLRTIGEHLDRVEVTTFSIFWAPDSVSVDYQIPGGNCARESFSIEKLLELGLHWRFRRSRRGA
jgi:hypothetical protein